MNKVKGAERVEQMVNGLRQWQGIERKAMEQTAEIMETTDNPFLRIIMEVIRHDSLMHHRVQQVIIDSLNQQAFSLTPEEIGEVWNMIEVHDATEREVIGIAEKLLEDAWTPAHKQLLSYLLADEKKHDRLLDELGELKKGSSPYSS